MRPFGMLRTRVVEFLAEVFKTFFEEVKQTFIDCDLFNTLLFYFESYPFHNVLHAKVWEILLAALDKNTEPVMNHLLYQTTLIKKILDTSREGGLHTFTGTGRTMNAGFVAFTRKVGNKLHDMQNNNEEVANFLASIPEWADYYENDLSVANVIEMKALGSDPRARM